MITANGVDLYYEKRGAGTPLVLLHGNGEDHHVFDTLAAALEDRYTLYLVDSRGHGQSAPAPPGYAAMAEDMYAFLTTLGLAPANLLGFSDGAIVALMLEMAHPGTLRKMALLGPNLHPDDFTPEALAGLRAAHEASGGDALLELMLTQPDIRPEALRAIHVPALLLAGERDIFRPETFHTIAGSLPDARLHILAGHDHSSYIEGSDLLAPQLAAFFG